MGLYDNERIRPLYDPETGHTAEEIEREREKSEVDQLIADGKDLEELKKTRGFKLVADFLQLMIGDYRDKLAIEIDYEKLRRLQEAVKCYHNVLSFIDWKINEAEVFKGLASRKSETDPSQEG